MCGKGAIGTDVRTAPIGSSYLARSGNVRVFKKNEEVGSTSECKERFGKFPQRLVAAGCRLEMLKVGWRLLCRLGAAFCW